MADTPVSLLERLRLSPDEESWERLVDLYTPLIRNWLGVYDVLRDDLADLVQDVLQVVVRELPAFEHNDQPGAFRHWLRCIVINRVRHYWRQRRGRPLSGEMGQILDLLEDPASDLSRRWDEEHNRHVASRLMERIAADFTPGTWFAFRRYVLDGVPPADVARETGLSVNAVLLARSRVLRRLREEGRGLIE